MTSQGMKLTNSQLIEFEQSGYLILKRILDPTTCGDFDRNIVEPALMQYAGIDPENADTWSSTESKTRLKSLATNDYSDKDKSNIILPGVMIRKKDGSDPIPDECNLDLSPLEPILDQLHNRTKHTSNIYNRNWKWMHTNVGWIHVRFPLEQKNIEKNLQNIKSWHIDGGHFSPHHIDSPEQSIVILPMIRSVSVGGGNTIILQKSHIYMAQKLQEAHGQGIPKELTQNTSEIAKLWPKHLIQEVAPCDKGDVIFLHPFLIHSAGQAKEGQPLRIAFNMGVRWKSKPIIESIVHPKDSESHNQLSWLENNICWCLKQPIHHIISKDI